MRRKTRIVKRPRAEQDLVDHYEYIARDKLMPAERFLRQADHAFERLAQMPGLVESGARICPGLLGSAFTRSPGIETTSYSTARFKAESKS